MFAVLPALYKCFITLFTFLSQVSITLSGQHTYLFLNPIIFSALKPLQSFYLLTLLIERSTVMA